MEGKPCTMDTSYHFPRALKVVTILTNIRHSSKQNRMSSENMKGL